jgi:hypothetical protein
MQLQNFECQIAKAQIGRYLAGDSLGEEAMEQLEAHIGKCADCKQNLAARRAVLQAMVSPTEEPEVATEESPKRLRFDVAAFIRSKVLARQQVHAVAQAPDAKPGTFTKPAMYSLGLGAVLIGMSYLSKNMGSMLGPKAEQTISAPSSKPTTAAPVALATTKPAVVKPQPKPAASPNKPAAITRKSAASKPEPKKISAPAHRHEAPRHSTNHIRVYAPEN